MWAFGYHLKVESTISSENQYFFRYFEAARKKAKDAVDNKHLYLMNSAFWLCFEWWKSFVYVGYKYCCIVKANAYSNHVHQWEIILKNIFLCLNAACDKACAKALLRGRHCGAKIDWFITLKRCIVSGSMYLETQLVQCSTLSCSSGPGCAGLLAKQECYLF